MYKKLMTLPVILFAVLLVGVGCSVPGEKSVISGGYLKQTKPRVVSAPVEPVPIATSTTSSPQ